MLEKTAKALTRKPKLVLAIAVAVLVLCIFGSAATRINYDILTYLPPDLDSSQGEQLLEEPFHMAATTMLIVEDMPPEYTNSLRREIEEVPGILSGADHTPVYTVDDVEKKPEFTVDGVKRRTRACMGLCQGKTCGRLVQGIVARETGQNPADVLPQKNRMPARPVKIGAFGGDEDV